jgi:hypothetical protein
VLAILTGSRRTISGSRLLTLVDDDCIPSTTGEFAQAREKVGPEFPAPREPGYRGSRASVRRVPLTGGITPTRKMETVTLACGSSC